MVQVLESRGVYSNRPDLVVLEKDLNLWASLAEEKSVPYRHSLLS